MKATFQYGLLALTLLAVASAFVHPFGPVKSQRSTAPLLPGAQADAAIIGVFERACQNCHTERTEWPWYSYVPPMSWLVEHDVHEGRSHMNLSKWDSYTPMQRVELLTKMGVEVRNRRMPLPNYLKLHPESRLSDEDVKQIYDWTRSERKRLRRVIETTRTKASTD